MGSADRPARRGELWLVAFGGGRPGEPTKNRPAVILADQAVASRSVFDLVVVVPLSATVAHSISRPLVAATADTGLDRDSVIVPRAIRGVTAARLQERLGAVDAATMDNLGRILAALLGLEN